MPATLDIYEMTAAAAGVSKTSGTIRFKTAESTVVDNNDPLVVPGAGTNDSFTKMIQVYMEDPPAVQVDTLVAYSDGTNDFGTGITLTYVNRGIGWVAPNDTDHAGTDFFTSNSGSPIDLETADSGPFLPGDDDTFIGDYLELQMHVASTATNGPLPPETLTVAWNEI